jgi:hypothetical protein
MTCPNSWKNVRTSECLRREGVLEFGFDKFEMLAAMAGTKYWLDELGDGAAPKSTNTGRSGITHW